MNKPNSKFGSVQNSLKQLKVKKKIGERKCNHIKHFPPERNQYSTM